MSAQSKSDAKKWTLTFVPLIVYIISFAYSVSTGADFTPEQTELLKGLLFAFLGSGTLGVVKGISRDRKA